MRLLRKLTNKEWAEIGEKYKDGGVHIYKGKKTFFYNGEKLYDANGDPLIYSKEERDSWKVIIILPGVEVILRDTFYGCDNVKTVIMADTVKRIEKYAFNYCSTLTFIRLSTSLECIGERAFSGCESLTSIFIPLSCREVHYGAFYGCKKLIVLQVPQYTSLGQRVIQNTSLILKSPSDLYASSYENHDHVNKWIKNRHDGFPLHNLCCSEDPNFNQSTIIPTKEECFMKDDCGLIPLIYLLANNTAKYDTVDKMVMIGGKELLFLEDKDCRNALHQACDVGDEDIIRLLVIKGGGELVTTLESETISEDQREIYCKFKTSRNVESALLLHDYTNAINDPQRDANIDQILDKLLESEPSYREVTEILSIQGIPTEHSEKLQVYNDIILEKELIGFSEEQEKVPLMRSTITVVGRGRDGKTSTINSLKGVPFQPYCESTKGAQTSEVDVHDVGIHVSSVEASGVTFRRVNNGNEKARTVEEVDTIKRKGDIDLGTKDDKSIRFIIYDNGGQRVFRSIQNLLLSRNGIFVVVFNMMNLIDLSKQEEALEHLKYWLSSIMLDASVESEDPSIKFPPVILVGTHYDLFQTTQGDLKPNLRKVDELLKVKLPVKELIPFSDNSTDSLRDSRQYLYNKTQDLCFWPIDNSNENDYNIRALRENLLTAATNDKGFNIKKEVPKSFLQTMEKLTELSKDNPIVPLTSDDPDQLSVLTIMQNCGVFKDTTYEEMEKFDTCKAILNSYHNIGRFIYFNRIGLDNYCIVDPQWLIDMITYVFRDFKLHRFSRDLEAMNLNDGESWKSLLDKGFLDGALLRKLWLDRKHEAFLANLMCKLGLFGKLYTSLDDARKHIYSVPTAITYSSTAALNISMPFVLSHLGLKSRPKSNNIISLAKCSYMLLNYYNYLVNRLVSEWVNWSELESNLPHFLPSAANLSLREDYKVSIIVNEAKKSLEIHCAQEDQMSDILCCIAKECKNVNKYVYEGSLPIDIIFHQKVNLLSKPSFAKQGNLTGKDVKRETGSLNRHKNSNALSDFLDGRENLARKIHEYDKSLTPSDLVEQYRNFNEDNFRKYVLQQDFGIGLHIDQSHIIKAIKASKEYSLKRNPHAIVNAFDENPSGSFDKQGNVKSETGSLNRHKNLDALSDFLHGRENLARKIHEYDKSLTPSDLVSLYKIDEENFKCMLKEDFEIKRHIDQLLIINVIRKCNEYNLEEEPYAIVNALDEITSGCNNEEKLIEKELKAAVYTSKVFGTKVFGDDIYYEIMKELLLRQKYRVIHFANGTNIKKDELYTCLEKSNLKCIFLNSPHSSQIASNLKKDVRNMHMIYWNTGVKHEVAETFTEEFYRFLSSGGRSNADKFEEAFYHAKKAMTLRGYIFLDPKDVKALEEKKIKLAKPSLMAAGLPEIFRGDQVATMTNSKSIYGGNPSSSSGVPSEIDIFISARFDGGEKEDKARQLFDALRKRKNLKIFMVHAKAGDDFGESTIIALCRMKVMVSFCFENYGQKTVNPYCSYHEVRYARDNDKKIIPVKLCQDWPPAPTDHDGSDSGKAQNMMVFNKGLGYVDWSYKNWDADQCAIEIEESFYSKFPEKKLTSIKREEEMPANNIEVDCPQEVEEDVSITINRSQELIHAVDAVGNNHEDEDSVQSLLVQQIPLHFKWLLPRLSVSGVSSTKASHSTV